MTECVYFHRIVESSGPEQNNNKTILKFAWTVSSSDFWHFIEAETWRNAGAWTGSGYNEALVGKKEKCCSWNTSDSASKLSQMFISISKSLDQTDSVCVCESKWISDKAVHVFWWVVEEVSGPLLEGAICMNLGLKYILINDKKRKNRLWGNTVVEIATEVSTLSDKCSSIKSTIFVSGIPWNGNTHVKHK